MKNIKKINQILTILSVFLLLIIGIVNSNEKSVVISSTKNVLSNKNILFMSNETSEISLGTTDLVWSNLTNEVTTKYFNKNIFLTVNTNEPVLEKHYFVTPSVKTLSELESANWLELDDSVEFNQTEPHIIYVKYVTNDNAVKYLNTDYLVVDTTKPIVNAQVAGFSYDSYLGEVDIKNLKANDILTVTANDLSGIKEISYYNSNQNLSLEDLQNIPATSFKKYDQKIVLNNNQSEIIYLKVVDNALNETFIKTDIFKVEGYDQKATAGFNKSSQYEALNLTTKSVLNFDFKYQSTETLEGTYSHHLVTNNLLPLNTIITLRDNVKNKVYQYKVTTTEDSYGYEESCQTDTCQKFATYPFILFSDLSKTNNVYQEDLYFLDNEINEDFTVTFDYSKTNVTSNLEKNKVTVILKDENSEIVRDTLNSTVSSYNLYHQVDTDLKYASLNLTSDINDRVITYNSNQTTELRLDSFINYKTVNETKVIDTRFDNKKQLLVIEMYDENNNLMGANITKEIAFRINSNLYSPSSDGKIRILLSNDNLDITRVLAISTFQNNGSLAEGNYYFKLTNYLSTDGHYETSLKGQEVVVPVIVKYDQAKLNYLFGVLDVNKKKVLTKQEEPVVVNYNIIQNGELENPRVLVSLYKKELLTAYDQNYLTVDLDKYLNNRLLPTTDNKYLISDELANYSHPEYLYNPLELQFITNNFDNTGYKLVFELYDNDKLVGTINKYFIVKEQ